MFTLSGFSAFFWTLAAIILAMLIFEDKLIALEEKYDRKRRIKKMPAINSSDKGKKLYTVTLGTGLDYNVYARSVRDAIDTVADYLDDLDLEGLVDHYELFDCCECGQTVDEYAQANHFICCGSHGIYLQIKGVMMHE